MWYGNCITNEEVSLMKQSGRGIASLVLGIIGMLTTCVVIGIVPCIIALIFSIISLLVEKNNKLGRKNISC